MRLHTFYGDDSFDFGQLTGARVLAFSGLTRAQAASVKLGYVLGHHFTSPQVGIIGNHQARHFTAEAFDTRPEDNYFFNYVYADLSLPKLRRYAEYMTDVDRLPTDTVIVQITTPNNDNGAVILDSKELLPIWMERPWHNAFSDFRGSADMLHSYLQYSMFEALDYTTILLGLFMSGRQVHVVDTALCAQGKDGVVEVKDLGSVGPFGHFLASVNVGRGSMFGVMAGLDRRSLCRPDYLHLAYQADGSEFAAIRKPPIIDENDVNARKRALSFGDEKRIAALMRSIDAAISASGRKCVFLIPPVYETERQTIVDQIFDKALSLVPNLTVIDHRHLRLPENAYLGYDHPGLTYYRILAQELRAKGLIPAPQEKKAP